MIKKTFYRTKDFEALKQEKTDFLIFVEDPGAVNYVAELPKFLLKHGYSAKILATGLAVKHLQNRQVNFEHLGEGQQIAHIMDIFAPRVVIVGTSENNKSFAFNLIEHCNSASIPSIGVIDMAVNAEYRFRGESKDPLKYRPQWLVLPDQATCDAFLKLGFPRSNMVLIGHPHYDYVRQKLSEFKAINIENLKKEILGELDYSKKNIVFLAQPTSLIDQSLTTKKNDYTLSGWNESTSRTDIVIESVIDALKPYRDSINFGVRLHPKNSLDEIAKYRQYLDFVSSDGDPLKVVYICDLIIGMSTMLLYESVLLQKQVLSVLPRESEKDWMPADAVDKIQIVFDPTNLNEALKDFMNQASDKPAVEAEQSNAMEKLIGFLTDIHRRC